MEYSSFLRPCIVSLADKRPKSLLLALVLHLHRHTGRVDVIQSLLSSSPPFRGCVSSTVHQRRSLSSPPSYYKLSSWAQFPSYFPALLQRWTCPEGWCHCFKSAPTELHSSTTLHGMAPMASFIPSFVSKTHPHNTLCYRFMVCGTIRLWFLEFPFRRC